MTQGKPSVTSNKRVPNADLTAIDEILPPVPLEDIFSPQEIAAMSEDERKSLESEDSGGVMLRSLHDVIAEAESPKDVWLWCLHCYRFFQVRHVAIDFLGNRQGCPFCGAAGFDIDIYLWNTEALDNPNWPETIEALRFGMRSPAGL